LWGTEGGLGMDLGAGLSAHGQVSYAWGEAELPSGQSEPLSRIPPLFGTTKIRYDHSLPKRWRAFVETYIRWARTQRRLSARDEEDSRIPAGGTPGWWTWNLRAGLADDGHHRLAVAVENLLDRRYKYHGSGLYASGLNALVSYEAGF
jgi:outer membrane receptor protein involved in Fe transport